MSLRSGSRVSERVGKILLVRGGSAGCVTEGAEKQRSVIAFGDGVVGFPTPPATTCCPVAGRPAR